MIDTIETRRELPSRSEAQLRRIFFPENPPDFGAVSPFVRIA
jgi:hypothetical protein